MAIVHVRPPDEIDPTAAPDFAMTLARVSPSDDVIVDFSNVTFCDSTGLRELLVAYQRQLAGGGSLVVSNSSVRVRRVFDITGLERLLTPI